GGAGAGRRRLRALGHVAQPERCRGRRRMGRRPLGPGAAAPLRCPDLGRAPDRHCTRAARQVARPPPRSGHARGLGDRRAPRRTRRPHYGLPLNPASRGVVLPCEDVNNDGPASVTPAPVAQSVVPRVKTTRSRPGTGSLSGSFWNSGTSCRSRLSRTDVSAVNERVPDAALNVSSALRGSRMRWASVSFWNERRIPSYRRRYVPLTTCRVPSGLLNTSWNASLAPETVSLGICVVSSRLRMSVSGSEPWGSKDRVVST